MSGTSGALYVGQRAATKKGKVGTIRFLGPVSFASGSWVGLELDGPSGKNNGSIGGKQYFSCPRRHGLFARATDCFGVDEGAPQQRSAPVVATPPSKRAIRMTERYLRDSPRTMAAVPGAPLFSGAPRVVDDNILEISSSSTSTGDVSSMSSHHSGGVVGSRPIDRSEVVTVPANVVVNAQNVVVAVERPISASVSSTTSVEPVDAAAPETHDDDGAGLVEFMDEPVDDVAPARSLPDASSRRGSVQTYVERKNVQFGTGKVSLKPPPVSMKIFAGHGVVSNDDTHEYIFFDGPGAGRFNWSYYKIGTKTIVVENWKPCGKSIDNMQTESVLEVSLFQSCLHRARGWGVITIHSEDPTTPQIHLKVPDAVKIYDQLRDHIGKTFVKEDISMDDYMLYNGTFFNCCCGRGCCCACCPECCETRTHSVVTQSTIKVRQRNCCFTRHQSVYMAWIYDGSLKTKCVCCCCCRGRCQYGDVTLYSFDDLNPELHIKMKENIAETFDLLTDHVDLKSSATDAWTRAKRQGVVAEAHVNRPRR